jgi:RES domain-containing protein
LRYWRISNHTDLAGTGGLRVGGRWHSAGRPVVYLADHPAGALLEVLVHLIGANLAALPESYQLLEVRTRGQVAAQRVRPESLPRDWRAQPHLTRALGDAWLKGGKSALLDVPSALVPGATNTLLNPRHAHAVRLAIVAVARHPFDERLFATGAARVQQRG